MRQMRIRACCVPLTLTLILILALGLHAAWAQHEEHDEPTGIARLQKEAAALLPLVETDVARDFLAAVKELPTIEPRTIYRDPQSNQWLPASQADQLPQERREALQERSIDETIYYYTRYGSPLAYVRVLDLMGSHGMATLDGRKILDFGYGTIGHLRVMAACGAHTVGLDVDSFLTALYSQPGDVGRIAGAGQRPGLIELHSGRFSDDAIRHGVGGGYDLITSKNTLKRGYIHPPADANVDRRMLIDLGVSDEEFLQTIFNALKPGGHLVIYNLSPRPAAPGEKYIPWADGRCPFERQAMEQAGFIVVELDRSDDEFARKMGHALGWDQGERPMDLANDLFALYTIVRRPPA